MDYKITHTGPFQNEMCLPLTEHIEGEYEIKVDCQFKIDTPINKMNILINNEHSVCIDESLKIYNAFIRLKLNENFVKIYIENFLDIFNEITFIFINTVTNPNRLRTSILSLNDKPGLMYQGPIKGRFKYNTFSVPILQPLNEIMYVLVNLESINIREKWAWYSETESHVYHTNIVLLEQLKPLLHNCTITNNIIQNTSNSTIYFNNTFKRYLSLINLKPNEYKRVELKPKSIIVHLNQQPSFIFTSPDYNQVYQTHIYITDKIDIMFKLNGKILKNKDIHESSTISISVLSDHNDI